MKLPRTILEETLWDQLEHAYAAASDTPQRLMELLDPDPAVRDFALAQLDMSVLHQDSLYSATAPAALFVAGILADPRTDVPHASAYPWDDRARSLRVSLIEWVGRVGDAASYGEGDLVEPFEDEAEKAAVAGCREIRADLAEAVRPFLNSSDGPVREAAITALALLGAAA